MKAEATPEKRTVTVVKQWRQANLFPREVVRRLSRSRHQQITTRLEDEKHVRDRYGPNCGPEKEKQ